MTIEVNFLKYGKKLGGKNDFTKNEKKQECARENNSSQNVGRSKTKPFCTKCKMESVPKLNK